MCDADVQMIRGVQQFTVACRLLKNSQHISPSRRLFQLIIDGRFRFEFVQTQRYILYGKCSQMFYTTLTFKVHSEEASSLVRQLLTPDLDIRLKSAAEVKVPNCSRDM